MKAIILAAGYGTRLEDGLKELKEINPNKYKEVSPFIEGKAKAMLELAGKPLIDYAVDNIIRAGIDQIYVVTNNKYFSQFDEWQKTYHAKVPIKIINDGTNTNEGRSGAVKDLQLVIKQENIDDSALVVASDNLFTFELERMVNFYNQKNENVTLAYREKNKERVMRSGNVDFDNNKRIIWFKEKPKHPKTDWICPPVYIYTPESLKLISNMKVPFDKRDFIGNIPEMFHTQVPFYVYDKEDKIRLDLGTIDDFYKANDYAKNL